jgi:hypothetical protein
MLRETPDDQMAKSVGEIKKHLGTNGASFTDGEIRQMITIGSNLAGKAVLTALICIIDDTTNPNYTLSQSSHLSECIKKLIPCNYSGYLQCSFDEIPHLLNISLSIVDKDYKTNIDIPSESYADDLFDKYNFLKGIAIAYWRQFCGANAELLEDIRAYRPDVDFGELVIDKSNPTTLYLDPNSEKRIGIFCYYVGPDGRPLYKKAES